MQSVFSLEVIWKYMIAHAVILFFLFMGLVNFSIPIMGEIRPYFILMPFYYFAIYRPTLLPPIFIFGIGLLYDLILGLPIGIHSLFFLTCFLIIKSQRLYFIGQGYHMTWIGFGLTVLSVLLVEYLFFSLKAGLFLSLAPITYAAFISVLLYPFISIILIYISRLLPHVSNVSLSVE